MKLGIDFRPALFNGAGIGRYTRELCRALPPLLGATDEVKLFGVTLRRRGMRPFVVDKGSRVRLIRKRFPNRLINLLARFNLVHVESFLGEADLFFYTDFVYPPLRKTPHVVILYDLLFMHGEGYHAPALSLDLAKRVTRVLAGARGVIVPSRAVEADVRRFFPGLGAPIRVIPLGGDHLPESGRWAGGDPPKNFFLSVGTFEPRKNHMGLLDAFDRIAGDLPRLNLVLAGQPGWQGEAFEQRLGRSPHEKRIHILEDVDDRVLTWLYRKALALVYPSLGEGFGLPLAEAMAQGCPVITSNRSSMAEVCGKAALLVDPENPKALAEAMRRVTDLREDLIEKGRQRAAAYTWKATAEATLDFFRERVREPDPR